MTDVQHMDVTNEKNRLPKELWAVGVQGVDPRTGRRKKSFLTFLSKVPARRLRERVVKYRGEDGQVVLLRAVVTDWEEVE